MKPAIQLCFAALVAATASCAGMNVPKTYVLNPDTGNGLAVFSISSNGPQSFFHYRRVGERFSRGSVDMWRINLRPDWYNPTSRLVAIELPAGSYEIHRWSALMGAKRAEPTESFSVPFAVVPGRATYLGNIHIEFGTARRATVLTRDMSARDLPLLHSRYPALLDESVDINIPRVHGRGTSNGPSDNGTP